MCFVQGCKVIAFAGSDDKVNWLKNDLHFDHVFNYKNVNFSEAISKVAPDGVEVFFDNVGGDFYHTIMAKHMKRYGRVSLCGSIENYNDKTPKLCKIFDKTLVLNFQFFIFFQIQQ